MTNSYERLEYLGDAVLDYLISTIIISSESLDVLDPGRITDIRYLTRVPDPGSGAFLTPGSGMGKKSRSGSGMNIEVFIRFKHVVFE